MNQNDATESNQELIPFLKEEFRENWAYIRHIEEIRLKHTNIYLLIVGAFISSLSLIVNGASKDKGVNALATLVSNYSFILVCGSLFVFLYGLFLSNFLSRQKRGYEHYRRVNAKIRGFFSQDRSDQFGFEVNLAPERSFKDVFFSVFFYWYLLVVLIDVLALAVFLSLVIPADFSMPGNRTLSIVLICLAVLLWQSMSFYLQNKRIFTTPG